MNDYNETLQDGSVMMSIKIHKSQLKYLGGLLAVFAVVILATLAFAYSTDWFRINPSLAELAIQPSELPEGSEWKGAAPVVSNDTTQPLNSMNGRIVSNIGRESLAYNAAYKAAAVIPSGQSVIYIGNYLYQYPDQAQAQAVAMKLINSILLDGGEPLSTFESTNADTLQGQSVLFASDGAGQTYWFVGVKDNILILLVADGMSNPESAIQESFKSTLEILFQK